MVVANLLVDGFSVLRDWHDEGIGLRLLMGTGRV